MSVEGSFLATPIFSTQMVLDVVGIAVIILAFLYFIFSLIVVRQVNLMTETVITEVAPLLRAFAIIHSGLALGIVILFIGFFLT